MRIRILAAICLIFVAALPPVVAQSNNVDRPKLAESVKTEFLHAWTGYKKYCWGHDDLKPISKTCRDWYGTPIYMTAVDSLDSLYLLGFKQEADTSLEYIAKNLSFDKD